MTHFVLQAHEVRLGDQYGLDPPDWTLHPDRQKEQSLRDERNLQIKQALQSGNTAAYRSSGWSLWARVHSNDLCLYLLVRYQEAVSVDDVVFCQVQPTGVYFAHLVKAKVPDPEVDGAYDYCISNQRGWVNGWCRIEDIYGRLFQVDHQA